ncbi:hypothetical protein JCM11491_005959 [Sporobolomyces phaffii]
MHSPTVSLHLCHTVTYDAPPTAVDPAGDATMPDAPPAASTSTAAVTAEREYPLVVRATDGTGKKDSKVKLSTLVQPQDYAAFTERYTTILRSHLTSGLRPKRKRTAAGATSTKKLKSKATSAAAKPDGKTTTPAAAAAATASGSASAATFTRNLPKVVGPRRGNGRKKRQAAQARRDQIVAKITKAREERARRAGQTV